VTCDDGTLHALGHHSGKYCGRERDVVGELCTAFEASPLPLPLRLQAFARHVRRQDIARFLAKYELFKLSLPVAGSIVECGVFTGGGVFAWLHFSSILEPYNHTRRVIGFDTFSGFPGIGSRDEEHGTSELLYKGAFQTHPGIMEEITRLADLHDGNRPLGHIRKVEMVAGDACETLPRYVEEHPHLLVSLLYLDFDIYEPTKAALDVLYPRVVKGGIVAFDELNCAEFPGETLAMLEAFSGASVELRRFPFEPCISYFIKN
jgi:hypothetical protein